MVIFDCNGVLVDSEPIAAAVLADAFNRAGVELIGEHARSDDGGRGVRLKQPGPPRGVSR